MYTRLKINSPAENILYMVKEQKSKATLGVYIYRLVLPSMGWNKPTPT